MPLASTIVTMRDPTGVRYGAASPEQISDMTASEFAEHVTLLIKATRQEKQWSFGAWLGIATCTREACTGTPEGVVRAWAIKRTGEQDRWKMGQVLNARGTAQRPDSGREWGGGSHQDCGGPHASTGPANSD